MILVGQNMVIGICSNFLEIMSSIRYVFSRMKILEMFKTIIELTKTIFLNNIFFQIMEDGRPWLDMAHVVACLNKLDSGVSDKVCLMSRDEQNVLVVSYSELKQCLDQSFSECIHAHRNTPTATSGASTMGGYAG